MKALLLAGFSALYGLFVWLWVRDWRRGEISRSPAFATVFRAKSPRRFWVWSGIHGSIFALAGIALIIAWAAVVEGELK